MKKVTLSLSESAYGELVFFAYEKSCSKSIIVEALLLAYFWHNSDLLKALVDGKIKNRRKEVLK